jgi:hypothetical protein
MLTLANDQLEVSVLDPVADSSRLGTRYVSGGYVYAVADRKLGILTSGPGYPREEPPPVFDGQGMPEAFRDPLWVGQEPGAPLPAAGTPMLMLGVGVVQSPGRPLAHGEVYPVQERATWQVSWQKVDGGERLVMSTRQRLAGLALDLTRELTLSGRTLASVTRLTNTGEQPIAFRWYPHPFFPNPSGETCKLNVTVGCPENPGYYLAENGWIRMKLDHEWDRSGHFQALTTGEDERLVVIQRHPSLGLLAAECSYVPSFTAIWGNVNTFSFEPYTEQTVAAGSSSTWSITYDF